ncbi:MAG: type II secretion system secretin GspD [Pseudomonadales bacterium]|nr:type II secretion system secretin GspD [Pseudomonadales bacterium]
MRRSVSHRAPSRSRRLVAALVLILGATTSISDERITLNMRDADIHAVLQWIADATGKRIVVDPRVRGNVTILARDPMSPEEALRVVIAAINVYGYTAIEQDDVLQIVPAANLKTGATQALAALADPKADLPVNEVLRLNNLPAEQLATVLRPLVPTYSNLAAVPGSNSLLITDTANNVQRIMRLARELDRSASLQLDVVPLKHSEAAPLLELMKQLLGAEESSALQMAVDERVNAIVIAGADAMRAQARELISRLDQPAIVEGSLQVIYLHYIKAAEMVSVLRGMLDRTQTEGSSNQPIAIEASESTNALVISAPPDRMDMMLGVVKKLDIRRAQVLVEAIIAEVGERDARELGVEWKTSFDGKGVEAISRFTNGAVDVADNPLTTIGRGLTLGYFRNGSLRALVRALELNQDNNILSTPSVVTLDNQEAEILVGSNVPFITGQSTSAGSPTSDPFTTIERQDIGITLKVTPQINQGDAITLDILQIVETLTDTQIAEDVVTDKRSVHTTVLLKDNDILVLGGLMQDQRTESVQKVPLLGDIPLLGALFRSTSEVVEKKNLMVFVRTRILTDFDDAEQETRDRYNRVRDTQQQVRDPDHDRKQLKSSPLLPPLEEPAG